MSEYIMISLGFVSICIVAIIALNPKSKSCKIDTKFGIDGFNISLETCEKSTPSSER